MSDKIGGKKAGRAGKGRMGRMGGTGGMGRNENGWESLVFAVIAIGDVCNR
jgi:hypothetical protein